MNNFTHLHLHTDGSKDGVGSVDRLLNHAKQMGFRHIAMTDHGNMINAVKFTNKAKGLGIKPIMGVEGYIDVDGKIGHITLLADGLRGFNSLVKLNNTAVKKSSGKRPSFTPNDLIKNKDGLIILSGCIASPLYFLEYNEALSFFSNLKYHFGGRLFAEMMILENSDSWIIPNKLSNDLDIPLVITNDVHFPFPEDANVQQIITLLKSGYKYDGSQLWLKSAYEIGKRAKELDVSKEIDRSTFVNALNQSFLLAEKIDSVDLSAKPQLPLIVDADRELEREAFEALHKYSCITHPKERPKERVKREIETIKRMGYSSYFLILKEIVQSAKNMNVVVGPGRGSGAGSLLLYLLGITEIDPLQYNLSFERFLNEDRQGMPDVDLDFASIGRDEILDYVSKKYDAVQIAAHSTLGHKSLVHDLCRILHYKNDEIRVKAADGGVESGPFKQLCDEIDGFEYAYHAMIGQLRHTSKHAGGVVIPSKDMKFNVPLMKAGKKTVTQWTEGKNTDLLQAGMVKFDLLGLSSMSAIQEMENLTGEKAPLPPHEKDDPVFDIFRNGNLAGIFQFSGSGGIIDLTVKVQPDCFMDLVNINGLYRPGALSAGVAFKYPEWKKSPRRLHRSIDDILQETAGIIIWQEQVMEIVRRALGGNAKEGDLARRLISKAYKKKGTPDYSDWEKKLKNLKERFVEGAKTNLKMSHSKALEIWNEIETHSGYSFNKSHSVAYTTIAWKMAWYKYYHPVHFFTAMLNIDPDNGQDYIFEAVREGITVYPPHVNVSTEKYENDGERIFLPVSAVKFVGDKAASAIIEARGAGTFKNLQEIIDRVPRRQLNSRGIKAIWNLGGFKKIDGCFSDFKIDYVPPIELNTPKLQFEHLGFVIPTQKMVETVSKANHMGYTAGIITEVKNKKSKYGPFTSYRLAPNGHMWARGKYENFKEGDLVVAKTTDYGRMKKAKRI